jgi:predicted glycoside hydrolase/deacetylase ChbG (UPF0249 family)
MSEGFPMSPTRRHVVIHEDDVGRNHSANVAFLKFFEAGYCTAGSVIVPCPWFPDAARIARNNPELDLGVHLTLKSELNGYKWRPLTGTAANGLTGPDGFFWDNVPGVRQNARHEAVERELRTQVQAALDAGIDVWIAIWEGRWCPNLLISTSGWERNSNCLSCS